MRPPLFTEYLALVKSVGINQLQSGSVKINNIFQEDGAMMGGKGGRGRIISWRRVKKDKIKYVQIWRTRAKEK